MMSFLPYHNLLSPPPGIYCGKIQFSCHCTTTLPWFSSIPFLKTHRIWWEATRVWISGNRQISSFRATRQTWDEPNCVRVVHMVLAYTHFPKWVNPTKPSMSCQCAFCMKIRRGIVLLFTEKRAPDGYTDGLFWSFDIERHLMISPERAKSYSMTFTERSSKSLRICQPISLNFPDFLVKKNDGCLSDHSQMHISF